MAHLIDKDALVAMIEKKIELNTKWRDGCETLAFLAANEAIEEDKQILSIINTLEVKEVEKEPKCMFTKDSYTDEDRKVLCEDCKEKCEYSKKEEPVNEDLKEEIED